MALRTRFSRSAGLPPGTLVPPPHSEGRRVRIKSFNFDSKGFEEKELDSLDDIPQPRSESSVTWINIDGLADIDVLERLGELFGIPDLVLEDILDTNQRPKFEDHERFLFLVTKMFYYYEGEREPRGEQVSFLLRDRMVITIQERAGDVFHEVRERIRNGRGRVRKRGPDYLLSALIDALVDQYFLVLETLGEQVAATEASIFSEAEPEGIQEIHHLRNRVIYLRRSVWPLREVVSHLLRGEQTLIEDSTRPFIRDIYDHTIQVADTLETFRDMLSGLLDVYLSTVSNRMNEVMKVLTIISTLFIPLSFVAGVYGMNFKFMPELDWRYGYPFVLFLMLAIALGFLWFFRKKKWL